MVWLKANCRARGPQGARAVQRADCKARKSQALRACVFKVSVRETPPVSVLSVWFAYPAHLQT
jgi:hypothetical protein